MLCNTVLGLIWGFTYSSFLTVLEPLEPLGTMPPKRPSPCHQWDFTLFSVGDEAAIVKYLKEHCKKFVFQQEKAALTNRLHYQGRISLREKKRQDTLITEWKDSPLAGAHISPTAGANRNSWSYVMKADTRVKGPWKDTDPEPQEEPEEIKGKKLYPWQQSIVEDLKNPEEDTRSINVLIDPSGGKGKGFLRKYLGFHQLAQVIPAGHDTKTMMQWVFQFPSTAYIIDIPRVVHDKKTQKRKQDTELWRSIEMIKDGIAVETRYKAQFRQQAKSPNVWVFMNEVPPLWALSADRWNLFMIHPDKKTIIAWSRGTMEAVEMRIKEINDNKPRQEKKQRIKVDDASDLFYFLAGDGTGEAKRERDDNEGWTAEEDKETGAETKAESEDEEVSERRSLTGLGGEGSSSSSSTESSSIHEPCSDILCEICIPL